MPTEPANTSDHIFLINLKILERTVPNICAHFDGLDIITCTYYFNTMWMTTPMQHETRIATNRSCITAVVFLYSN